MAAGAPGSAGTKDTAVDRIEEGTAGPTSVVSTQSGATVTGGPFRAKFDDAVAGGGGTEYAGQAAQISTDGTSRLDQAADIKRGKPNAW
jgi:hypothetical protein